MRAEVLAEVAQTAGREEAGAGVNALHASAVASESAPADAGVCPECEGTLVGDFCHRCGEKRLEARDLSVRHFFSEAAQELTSVEHSKLFHTIRALLFRPGFLTNEWVAGRRRRYLKPLNLCLGILAISLFAFSVYKPVSTYDIESLLQQDGRPEVFMPVDRLAAKKRTDRSSLLDRVSDKWQRYMSLSPLPIVGAFALALQFVFMFSRRYFVEHLVFSMHFVSFSTLTVVMLWPVYFLIGIKQGPLNYTIAALKWSVDIAYMYFAVRAVYGLRPVRTLLASVLLVACYFVSYMAVLLSTLVAATVSVALS
ncbi:MAG: DUF3667 domain-containing protein [Pyrinomonadaceae bacterium]